MKRMIFLMCLALALWGCGEQFAASPDGGVAGAGGSGGTAGTGGNTGGSAGTGGTGNTGGNAGQGGTGNTGNTGGGGQGGQGGGNPCPDITYNAAAALIGEACANLFASGCGTSNPVPREEFISAVIGQVPEKLQGYSDPVVATFGDVALAHPAFSAIEKAVWLELVPVTPFFHPADPTTTCFAQDVVTAMGNLPDIYAVVFSASPSQNLGSGVGAVDAVIFKVYGTNPGNHLTQMLRLVNNLSGGYTAPQTTTALEAVLILCEVPAGGSFTTYSLPLTAGAADFNSLNCYKNDGSPMELHIQVDPVAVGQVRIGIDPTTITIRGKGQVNNPIFTIQ
ncbi:hypothetical protein KJ657_03925 [Patescibacteria group bacterium]|nr:hypothetical protein [Patescibacteria group bacterium]MBU1016212.1 hypothetical protein [Patescibacteria group bacterium]MBU1684671.1 hypothetical protein [Patescibacteria group bacterium]MBU1938922.1 hypothetical protein [Patescibacteria group bacterium]